MGILVNCGSNSVTHWEQPFAEEITFPGPPDGTHAVSVSLELDPAMLMGWQDGRVQNQLIVDVSGGGRTESKLVPITALQDVVRQGEVVGQTYGVAGVASGDGYYVTEPVLVLRFKADGGPIEVRTRVGSGASRMPLKVPRKLLLQVTPGWTPPAAASGTQSP